MATQLKNIVRFANTLPGVPVSLPHGLAWSPPGGGELPQIPDVLWPEFGGFTVTADATNVTVTNNTAVIRSIDVLAELWHSHERAFGDQAILELTPRPFVMKPGGPDEAMAPVLGFGSGFLGVPDTEGESGLEYLFPWFCWEDDGPATYAMAMAAPRPGTLKNLYIKHNTPLPAMQDVTYTLLVNGAPTALTLVVPGGASEAFLLAVNVLVAQGDDLAMQVEHGVLTGQGTVQVDVVATMLFAD